MPPTLDYSSRPQTISPRKDPRPAARLATRLSHIALLTFLPLMLAFWFSATHRFTIEIPESTLFFLGLVLVVTSVVTTLGALVNATIALNRGATGPAIYLATILSLTILVAFAVILFAAGRQ